MSEDIDMSIGSEPAMREGNAASRSDAMRSVSTKREQVREHVKHICCWLVRLFPFYALPLFVIIDGRLMTYSKWLTIRPWLFGCVYMSLLVIYFVELVRGVRGMEKSDRAYWLLSFHLVKVPFYLVVLVVYIFLFCVLTFYFQGFTPDVFD